MRSFPFPLLCVANVCIGAVFLIVGSVYLAGEIRQKESFDLVDCRFVDSDIVPAKCPRLHYEGCGCSIFKARCDEVGPDSDKSYCCSGKCRERYYSRGEWRTRYEEKEYRVTYVGCQKINMVFEIAGKNETYSYVCDDGVRLPKLPKLDKQADFTKTTTCETMYEGRTQCYFDGSEIRMSNPYDRNTVIWSSLFVALGGLLILVAAANYVYQCTRTDRI